MNPPPSSSELDLPERARVCLIDDDELVLEVVARDLRQLGYAVVYASEGNVGLQIISAQDLDAVIVDMLMPGIDGLEVLAYCRARKPSLPVIAISGGGRLGAGVYLEAAQALGADVALPKPVDMAALDRALKATTVDPTHCVRPQSPPRL